MEKMLSQNIASNAFISSQNYKQDVCARITPQETNSIFSIDKAEGDVQMTSELPVVTEQVNRPQTVTQQASGRAKT